MHQSIIIFNLDNLPVLAVVGLVLLLSVFAGRAAQKIKLPSLMGFMFLGIIMGPFGLKFISHHMLSDLGFITELALGFVALAIGFELNFASLKHQGKLLAAIVVCESLFTFALATSVIAVITRNIPLALVFGSIAVTTAPAGKVAVIQENNARGPFTRAILAVVGFDDAAAVFIFGFALAVAKYLIVLETGAVGNGLLQALMTPVIEITASLVVGILIGLVIGIITSRLGKSKDVLIVAIACVFLIAGLTSIIPPLSLVLTAMIAGMTISNTQSRSTTEEIGANVKLITPFMFVLFFAMAGAHLDFLSLPKLGILGISYILARSAGKIIGTWFGSAIGKAEGSIRKYLGISLLSQAGLAIGLGLIALQELSPLGAQAEAMARTVIITITASSIVFELIGPVLTRYSLGKAGEIHPNPY